MVIINVNRILQHTSHYPDFKKNRFSLLSERVMIQFNLVWYKYFTKLENRTGCKKPVRAFEQFFARCRNMHVNCCI